MFDEDKNGNIRQVGTVPAELIKTRGTLRVEILVFTLAVTTLIATPIGAALIVIAILVS